MVERLLLYLDVATIQRLAATCRLLHQLVHGRFMTCLQVPFDRAFIEEVRAAPVLEKKPLLRLVCPKSWFMAWWYPARGWGFHYTLLTSQLALLQLHMLREVRLEAPGGLPGWSHCHGVHLLDHLSGMGALRRLVRLDAPMSLVSRLVAIKTRSTDFPALTDLSIRMDKRKGQLAAEFYRINSVILPKVAVSRLQLTVLPEVTRLARGMVVHLASPQVEVLEVQGPCNLQIQAYMPRLRVVVARPVCPPEGPSCTFGRGREAPHRLGRCLVDIECLFTWAPPGGYRGPITFNKVELPVVEGNPIVALKKVLYKAYKGEGGTATYKAWHKANWS